MIVRSLSALVLFLYLVSPIAAGDFFAYYTRLDYVIPIEEASHYIPTEVSAESEAIIDRMVALEEAAMAGIEEEEWHDDEEHDEDEERDRQRPRSKALTGRYADIVVHLADGQELIFSRENAYRPLWRTSEGDWPVESLVDRQLDVGCLYSYARILENSPSEIVVHWRYMPDLHAVGPNSAVHEMFTITPDGGVERRVRQACADLDEWNDPANVTVQKLKLDAAGVTQVSLTRAKISRFDLAPIAGAPVTEGAKLSPIAEWRFDEGLATRPYEKKDLTSDTTRDIACEVRGNTTLWKRGVSGTALAFDGYKSTVVCPAEKAPALDDELTVEAWVVLGALPWNWAPLIHQSVVDPGPIEKGNYDDFGRTDQRKPGQGYYLGVDAMGRPFFTVNGLVATGSEKIQPYRWTHVAATYGGGQMTVYVDGRPCGSIAADGRIVLPPTDMLIGLNNRPGRATDPIRGPICHLARVFGIEGLIDEVRVYDRALSEAEVGLSFERSEPSAETRENPDLERRVLPGMAGVAEAFGASYTDLGYHELWDVMWRETNTPDVVVKFDKSPASVVFWRGVNGGVGWVTENNKWMSDQSLERFGPHGCAEHMSDKENRHAHVRLIENTPARVVVHWRYASIDINYLFPNIRDWTDEYYYIYPDCVAVRKVNYRNGEGGWHDVQFLNQPGTSPRDNIDRQAVDVANLSGDVHKLTWTPPNHVPKNPMRDACIRLMNFKSEHKVFVIYPGDGIGAWGEDEQSPHTNDPFAGPWNHWPVSLIRSDGRYAVSNDRLTHAALGGGNTRGEMAMYGLTDKPIADLVPLARMWRSAPPIVGTDGCLSEGFQMDERAYHFVAQDRVFSFTIEGSQRSPVVNPCFVVKNWSGDAHADVRIKDQDGQIAAEVSQGVVRDTNGERMLVVWVNASTTEELRVEVH